jgi:preprotein translocase subunit SecB
MKISPLRLKGYWLTEVSIRTNPSYNIEGELANSPDVQLKGEVTRARRDDDAREWKVDLRISLSEAEKPLPYQVTIGATGIFEVLPGFPDDVLERLVAVNAPAVLFGSMREIVAQITSRGPYDQLILPSVTFIDERPRQQETPSVPELTEQKPIPKRRVRKTKPPS